MSSVQCYPAVLNLKHFDIEVPLCQLFEAILQSRPYKEQRKSGDKQDESRRGKVEMEYHPMDLSTLYVYVSRPHHEDWLAVPAVNQQYTKGLSIVEHKVIRNYILRQKKDVDIDGLSQRKSILGIVERQFGLALKVLVRKKAARYLGSGRNQCLMRSRIASLAPTPTNERAYGDAKKE